MNFVLPVLNQDFYVAAAPILILCISSLIALLSSVFKTFSGVRFIQNLNLTACVITFFLAIRNFVLGGSGQQTYLSGGLVAGRLGDFGQGLILGIAIVVSLLMNQSHLREKFNRGEIVSMFHIVLAGMLTMVCTDDLITLFIGLEMASIGIYALVGYTHPSKISQEASIKYFILGAVAAAILLFGFAFLYAATGSMRISEISTALASLNSQPWAQLGVILTLVGIGFKMALVPFHMWTPDAYEGSPTGLTAFMATAMKVMIMIAAIRMFEHGMSQLNSIWVPAFGFMAAASLLFANILALAQQSVKRLLAYSSISHSGYMALALVAMGGQNQAHQVPSILFYLVSYVVVSLGSFAIIMWLENERCENLILDDLSGLAKKHPYAAVALAVFMFSLGGMPPTIGFISKLYVFNSAISNHLYGLVVVAAIGSTISLYYYMRVIVRMFMMEPNAALTGLINPKKSWVTSGVVCVSLALVLLMGTVLPENLMKFVKASAAEVALK